MDKLERMAEQDTDKIREWAGGDREPPPNLRIITDKPWDKENHPMGMLGSYTPIGMEYRQLFQPERGKPWGPFAGDIPCAYGHYIFFHNKTGIAYLWCGSERRNPRQGYHWFAFGCDHEDEHVATLGNCYNQYRCKKCGYTHNVDSSD